MKNLLKSNAFIQNKKKSINESFINAEFEKDDFISLNNKIMKLTDNIHWKEDSSTGKFFGIYYATIIDPKTKKMENGQIYLEDMEKAKPATPKEIKIFKEIEDANKFNL